MKDEKRHSKFIFMYVQSLNDSFINSQCKIQLKSDIKVRINKKAKMYQGTKSV